MSQSKPYRVEVFGKAGCDKCAVLNQRLDKLLGEETWQSFEKVYRDVLTEDGLVEFSEARGEGHGVTITRNGVAAH